jgi:hypothetical protein
MQDTATRHIEEMEMERSRTDLPQEKNSIDTLAEMYGLNTRAEKRAFKSNLRRLLRKEARKTSRKNNKQP